MGCDFANHGLVDQALAPCIRVFSIPPYNYRNKIEKCPSIIIDITGLTLVKNCDIQQKKPP